ncbi:AP-5 complex subunit beta-1 [Elgaria multicarinata webbii]|uniref:AP-5 complex subunit beta-1 n=1 Tax=Elgaria multicarinata webbii TaxID=159646 RepID=UPI002FCCDD27
MGSRGGEGWASTIASFRSCPTAFLLSHEAGDTFVAELLQELRGDKLGESVKVSVLTLFLEYPTLLCPDAKAGQDAAASLLSLFAQLGPPPKYVSLRRHLLFATGTVLVTTDAFGEDCPASGEYLSLLLHLASDLNDRRGPPAERPVRAAACECLRELECCYPGLLSQRLEVLRSLQQEEASPAHQGYTLLYSSALRNAVLLLARSGRGTLGEVLAGSEGLKWEATKEWGGVSSDAIDQLALLPSPGDLKELKSVVSALLEGSFLLSPAAQSHLLWQLAQVVSVVRTQSPAIFKAQLVRLFGTADAALQHAILQLKSLFTDSLFTAEDEAFLLRRLVGLAQHPALPAPVNLFHLDCLLHFPENRPLGSGPDEGLPVLLTPRTTSGLFPGLFQDQGTVLARLNLMCLVCVESEGPAAEQGAGYLLEHVLALGGLVGRGGGPEATRLFFRAVFLFARYFGSREQPMAELTQCLLSLYHQNHALAPNIINLLDVAWGTLEETAWARSLACSLQELVVSVPLHEGDLGWHLKVLARLAKEKGIPQASTLHFLRRLVASGRLGDWRSGQTLLSVCRNLMQLRPPPAPARLADLLQAVSLSPVDVDVQDRARFYYTLLANLSDEKLRAVLVSESPVKARTLSSSIVADSESFVAALTVHRDERAPLKLRRVETRADGPAAPPPPPGEDVDSCCRGLLEARSPSQLHLTYQLAHAGPSAPPFGLLLCVVLRFTGTDRHYEPVPDLCVPCLSAYRPPRTLTLTLEPRCPYPTRLDVSALYTTQEGFTRCSQLEPLEIAFPDLFMPLAVPAWPPEKQRRLFDALWCELCPESKETCAESLTIWPVPPGSLGGLVHDHFARYIVSEPPGSYEIAAALPPRYHILLRVQSVEDAARVAIRTDNWKLLPSLNSYLQSLVGDQASV